LTIDIRRDADDPGARAIVLERIEVAE